MSNASILRYDLNSKEFITYATGIRNVEGLAVNSIGKLTAIVGGMEDNGVRSVKDDVDYIYDIKEKAWYGWPDFSGGDPMFQPEACTEIAKYAKKKNLNIWVYTGFTYEELLKLSKTKKAYKEFLKYIDVLVDGRFMLELKNQKGRNDIELLLKR